MQGIMLQEYKRRKNSSIGIISLNIIFVLKDKDNAEEITYTHTTYICMNIYTYISHIYVYTHTYVRTHIYVTRVNISLYLAYVDIILINDKIISLK